MKKIIKRALVTFLLFFFTSLLIVSPIQIYGNSMYPSYKAGEFVVYQRLFYKEINKHDVIVFRNNDHGTCIKRVVGIEGDRISSKNNILCVNDNIVPHCEYYTPNEILLKQDEYFVVGDNYVVSIDSRDYGIVYQSDIIGKIVQKIL